MYKRYNQTRNS